MSTLWMDKWYDNNSCSYFTFFWIIVLPSFSEKCNETQFNCKAGSCKYNDNTYCDGSCIPKIWLNNGRNDCTDGSDEPLTCKWGFFARKYDLTVNLLWK